MHKFWRLVICVYMLLYFVQLSGRPLPSIAKCQNVGHRAMPSGIAESCEGLAVRLSSRPQPSLTKCARVRHSAPPSGIAMAFEHSAGSDGESLMMTSPMTSNATLYRGTKHTWPSTYTRARAKPLYTAHDHMWSDDNDDNSHMNNNNHENVIIIVMIEKDT